MSPDRKLLEESRFMTLATICSDGSPWNVPVTFVFREGSLYWRSADETIHSQNIAHDNRVSVSIFDAQPRPGESGLQAFYLQSRAEKVSGEEQKRLLGEFGDKFSIKDANTPLYRVPIGDIDEVKSSDARFYRKVGTRA